MEDVIQRGIELLSSNPQAAQSILIAIGIGIILPFVLALVKGRFPQIDKNWSYALAFIFSFVGALIADAVVNHFNWTLIIANLSFTFTTSQVVYHFVLELLGWKERLERTN